MHGGWEVRIVVLGSLCVLVIGRAHSVVDNAGGEVVAAKQDARAPRVCALFLRASVAVHVMLTLVLSCT